jgi:cysteine-rich repeat protein
MRRAVYAIPTVGLLCGGCSDDSAPVLPICGDGMVNSDVEQCDDANAVETDDCLSSCLTASCGDGVVRVGQEQCDDANAVDGDQCTNACNYARCGDGIKFDQAGGAEQCDDANQVTGDGCTNACTNATCGDGVLHDQAGGIEQCDDHNAVSTDGCLADCSIDPIVQAFEITKHDGVALVPFPESLCTSSGTYGCYAYTSCNTTFDAPLVISMALLASGSYSRARVCADTNFNTATNAGLTGKVAVITTKSRYLIALTEGAEGVVLDCVMHPTTHVLTCVDDDNQDWELTPES